MARPEKVAVVDEVKRGIDSSAAILLTEYRGLSVADLHALRTQLTAAGCTYRVAKNTLIRRAVAEAGVDVPTSVLIGPTALAYADEDPVAVAKALRAFAKDHPSLVVKGGILDGAFLDATAAAGLADLASREDLLAMTAGMLGSLLAAPARLANANLSKAARLFGARQAQLEEAA